MPSGLLKGFDMRTLSAALAALTLGFAGTAMAQEAVSPSSSATAGLADLEMWHQAGMTYLPSPSADREVGYNSAEYQRGLARYQQLRSGPAYREAVARLEGQHTVTQK
jgi:hypothetical protein